MSNYLFCNISFLCKKTTFSIVYIYGEHQAIITPLANFQTGSLLDLCLQRAKRNNKKSITEGAYQITMISFGKYQYKAACEQYSDCQAGEHEGYAIVGKERFGRKACVLKDVTVSRDCADLMARIMNNNQVDLCQMQDVTEDLLATLKS